MSLFGKVKTAGRSSGFEEYYGTIHGICSYYDPFSLVNGNTPIQPETKDFYYTDVISDHAIADIDEYAGGDRPFFLYAAYTTPHWPLQAPEPAIAKYRQRYLNRWRPLSHRIIDKTQVRHQGFS
jgi:arylsulfatase A-like enzyme